MSLFGGFNSVWQMLHEVLVELKSLRKRLKGIEQVLVDLQASDTKILKAFAVSIELEKQILALLLPPPPVKFIITFIGEDTMGEIVKSSINFQLLDNGTATATLTPVDAAGNPTSMPTGATIPVWTSSDMAVSVLASGDGMSATLTPSGSLATGVIITADAILADGTTHIMGTGNPIDVIAGPATGFKIVEG